MNATLESGKTVLNILTGLVDGNYTDNKVLLTCRIQRDKERKGQWDYKMHRLYDYQNGSMQIFQYHMNQKDAHHY